VRDGADDATDLGCPSRQFLKIEMHRLRQVGTTGSLRMAHMRWLPVAKIAL
jgi:hypothetical protein